MRSDGGSFRASHDDAPFQCKPLASTVIKTGGCSWKQASHCGRKSIETFDSSCMFSSTTQLVHIRPETTWRRLWKQAPATFLSSLQCRTFTNHHIPFFIVHDAYREVLLLLKEHISWPWHVLSQQVLADLALQIVAGSAFVRNDAKVFRFCTSK